MVYDASKNAKVRYYLETPFLKTHGNGDSDKSLYRAMCICLSCNDIHTLEKVESKAESEKWTKRELSRKLDDAKKYLARSRQKHISWKARGLENYGKQEEQASSVLFPVTGCNN